MMSLQQQRMPRDNPMSQSPNVCFHFVSFVHKVAIATLAHQYCLFISGRCCVYFRGENRKETSINLNLFYKISYMVQLYLRKTKADQELQHCTNLSLYKYEQ